MNPPRRHLLLVHPEAAGFGGAEQMLGYFVDALTHTGDWQVTVALASPRVSALLPPEAQRVEIHDNSRFSLRMLRFQMLKLDPVQEAQPVDVIHGWAARDWELAACLSRRWHRPALGTLHDHPGAYYIRPARRWLMRCASRWGLRRVVCVSDAVRKACEQMGYETRRLAVVRNGLPSRPLAPRVSPCMDDPLRLGFMGHLVPGKGIDVVLRMLDCVAWKPVRRWQLNVAGQPADPSSAQWLAQLKGTFGSRPWWSQVHWSNWVDNPRAFQESLDLLIFASTAFDSFPTVLLEAAWSGLPVLASDIGGASEIVADGRTGWLFPPGDWQAGAGRLAGLFTDPATLATVGKSARRHAEQHLSADKMIAGYRDLYRMLLTHD